MVLDSPLVSVIMPVYNGGKYVAEAIESILNQSYPHIQLLICDDNSKDKSKNIIEKYQSIDKRIEVFYNTINLGAAATRNKLIKASKGEFIALMDADDVSDKKRIEKQLDYLKKKHLDGCGSSYLYFNETGVIKEINTECSPGVFFFNAFFHLKFCNSSLFIKKSCFKNNLYNERLKSESEDFDLITRLLLKKYKLGNTKAILYKYRSNPKSVSFINKKEQAANSLKISQQLYKSFLQADQIDEEFIRFVKYYHLQSFNLKHSQIPLYYKLLKKLYYKYAQSKLLTKKEEDYIKEDISRKLIFLSLNYRKIDILKSLNLYINTFLFYPKSVLNHFWSL